MWSKLKKKNQNNIHSDKVEPIPINSVLSNDLNVNSCSNNDHNIYFVNNSNGCNKDLGSGMDPIHRIILESPNRSSPPIIKHRKKSINSIHSNKSSSTSSSSSQNLNSPMDIANRIVFTTPDIISSNSCGSNNTRLFVHDYETIGHITRSNEKKSLELFSNDKKETDTAVQTDTNHIKDKISLKSQNLEDLNNSTTPIVSNLSNIIINNVNHENLKGSKCPILLTDLKNVDKKLNDNETFSISSSDHTIANYENLKKFESPIKNKINNTNIYKNENHINVFVNINNINCNGCLNSFPPPPQDLLMDQPLDLSCKKSEVLASKLNKCNGINSHMHQTIDNVTNEMVLDLSAKVNNVQMYDSKCSVTFNTPISSQFSNSKPCMSPMKQHTFLTDTEYNLKENSSLNSSTSSIAANINYTSNSLTNNSLFYQNNSEILNLPPLPMRILYANSLNENKTNLNEDIYVEPNNIKMNQNFVSKENLANNLFNVCKLDDINQIYNNLPFQAHLDFEKDSLTSQHSDPGQYTSQIKEENIQAIKFTRHNNLQSVPLPIPLKKGSLTRLSTNGLNQDKFSFQNMFSPKNKAKSCRSKSVVCPLRNGICYQTEPVAINLIGGISLHDCNEKTKFNSLNSSWNSEENGFLENKINHNSFSKLKTLESVSWYWGRLGWEMAEQLLEGSKDGTFLVRDSSDFKYAISFRTHQNTHHTKIEQYKPGMFGFQYEPLQNGEYNIVDFIEQAMEHSRKGKFLYFLRPKSRGTDPVPVQLLYPLYIGPPTLKTLCNRVLKSLKNIDLNCDRTIFSTASHSKDYFNMCTKNF